MDVLGGKAKALLAKPLPKGILGYASSKLDFRLLLVHSENMYGYQSFCQHFFFLHCYTLAQHSINCLGTKVLDIVCWWLIHMYVDPQEHMRMKLHSMHGKCFPYCASSAATLISWSG